ncbi:hypothetical protein M0Q50_02290 [bacterium]|nr:hypothetical protein [bacterium]
MKKKEKRFLELAHLDELMISFNFLYNYDKNELFYYYDGHTSIHINCIFSINKKEKNFIIDSKFASNFNKKFKMSYKEMLLFIGEMVEKHFNLINYDIIEGSLPETIF